ncbi:kinesin-related [Holotrichia oblita]|uniref:Kinesin-related n=1 Tax=Holotrichia oblita TaxID=644536 RepID=A0ACB9TWZ3_HOLOL|nr:kinesin-related [Holotrichia oblita]
MVKNKRDLKSPRRRSSLLSRAGVRGKLSSAKASANIKVVVRVRPPNEKESGENSRMVVKVINDQLLVFDPEEDTQPFFYHGVEQKRRDLLKKSHKNMKFYFDRVYGFDASNNDVFETTTSSLINRLMDGCNCSVFVYGATGAGKTHTMLGHAEHPGITFLTMQALFEKKTELSTERDFELGVTYLEVYNENVQDLLNPGSTLHLREDGKYGVVVAGIKVKRIDASEELFEMLDKGNKNRTQHPTDANAESSRSHAVFQVYMKMTFKTNGQVRVAKLSMIDLAGSERGAATGCAGMRFTEGANINRSLLALGNCINSLAGGLKHVPYRDSKLTRLLKDSLGGNCQTVMIANISPSSITYEDTYNTLKYATRAKKIKSNVKKNVMNTNVDVEHYIKLVDDLTNENQQLKLQLAEALKSSNDSEKENTSSNNSTNGEFVSLGFVLFYLQNCECNVNSESRTKLLDIFSETRKLEERLHKLEMHEQLLSIRRTMKENADARISDVCTDTPERTKGHKRLGATLERLTKNVNVLQEELSVLQGNKKKLQEQVTDMLQNEPNLKYVIDLEGAKLNVLESKYEVENQVKLNEKLSEEIRAQGEMIDKMSSLLRTCYLHVKGQGFATDTLDRDYQTIVRDLQGFHSVSFHENIPLPCSPIAMSNGNSNEEESRKRKLNEGSTCSLDSTFVSNAVKPSGKPALTACAELLLTKGGLLQHYIEACANQLLYGIFSYTVLKRDH